MTHRNDSPDRGESGPPSAFSPSPVPVKAENPVTMVRDRRVRPQAFAFDEEDEVIRLLYSTEGSEGITQATSLAESDDGGYTWEDHPGNPVLDRIESVWQGSRAFVTALTRDAEAGRWVMATVGNDTSGHTPGRRAVGLWFSENLTEWTQYEGNPIITVETDGARENTDVFPGPDDSPVGMYLRDFQRLDGEWHALVQWRGAHTWSRMTVMRSEAGLTGPWRIRTLPLDPADATPWLGHNDVMNWCQPVRVDGRWYAVCQNGVGADEEYNAHVGIVYSEDYLDWHEFDNPVTPELTRADGSPLVPSQQFLLPPREGRPWRVLLGARGEIGSDSYMYLLGPAQSNDD
jgi:hypothetical protein